MEKLTNNRQDLVLQQFLRCSGDYKNHRRTVYKVYLCSWYRRPFLQCVLNRLFQYRLQSVKGHIVCGVGDIIRLAACLQPSGIARSCKQNHCSAICGASLYPSGYYSAAIRGLCVVETAFDVPFKYPFGRYVFLSTQKHCSLASNVLCSFCGTRRSCCRLSFQLPAPMPSDTAPA